MTRIAVIGGGAAGMIAAATLSEKDTKVFLLEKNQELGKKVKISGGGRCNVTTGVQDLKQVLKAYPRGANFFRTALYDFPPTKVFSWFEDQGVQMKIEKDLRVFPVSDDGNDVVGVFEKIFSERNVLIEFGADVQMIEKRQGQFLIRMQRDELKVDKVILATGGQAYRHTGSEGDGYKLAEGLGHSVTALGPSLNSFLIEDDWVKSLSGVSFKDLRLRMAGKEFRGPIIFTHRGISGPAVFALSSLCAFEKIKKDSPLELSLDFCPNENYDSVKGQIEAASNKQSLAKAMSKFTTKSFVSKYSDAFSLNLNKKGPEISKKELNKVVEILKNTKITVVGRLPGDEFVTAGGIDLKEINSKTMESKICPGLYFAGEILNIDGFTGGYNLQVAWATGRLAGKSVGLQPQNVDQT